MMLFNVYKLCIIRWSVTECSGHVCGQEHGRELMAAWQIPCSQPQGHQHSRCHTGWWAETGTILTTLDTYIIPRVSKLCSGCVCDWVFWSCVWTGTWEGVYRSLTATLQPTTGTPTQQASHREVGWNRYHSGLNVVSKLCVVCVCDWVFWSCVWTGTWEGAYGSLTDTLQPTTETPTQQASHREVGWNRHYLTTWDTYIIPCGLIMQCMVRDSGHY